MNSVKSISFLWLGSLIGAGVAFMTQVVLARVLGADSFGLFASGLAMAMLIAPIASFGIGPYWLKVFGSEGWGAIRWVTPSLKLAMFSISTGVLILLFWGAVGPHGIQSRLLIFFLAAHLAGQASLEIASSKLQLEERFLELAIWQLFPHIVRMLLIVIAFIFLGNFINFGQQFYFFGKFNSHMGCNCLFAYSVVCCNVIHKNVPVAWKGGDRT